MTKCLVELCNAHQRAKGFCQKHYVAFRCYGDPLVNKRDKGGISKHRMYRAWSGMVNRCHNKNNSSYHQYGLRGISVCDRWRFGDGFRPGFAIFLDDMGERPHGMTLDRVDPEGGYGPENCRWATAKEQRRNISASGRVRQAHGASIGATRSAMDYPYERAVLSLLLERGETLSSFARRHGFKSTPFIISALRGKKQISPRLMSALRIDGLPLP